MRGFEGEAVHAEQENGSADRCYGCKCGVVATCPNFVHKNTTIVLSATTGISPVFSAILTLKSY